MVSGKHVEVLVYSTLPRQAHLPEFQQLNLARGNYAMGTKTFKSKTGKTPYAQPLGHEVLLPAELVAP